MAPSLSTGGFVYDIYVYEISIPLLLHVFTSDLKMGKHTPLCLHALFQTTPLMRFKCGPCNDLWARNLTLGRELLISVVAAAMFLKHRYITHTCCGQNIALFLRFLRASMFFSFKSHKCFYVSPPSIALCFFGVCLCFSEYVYVFFLKRLSGGNTVLIIGWT